jgi:GTP-binding protein EngB required for normal cell division
MDQLGREALIERGLRTVEEMSGRYRLAVLGGLLESCRRFARDRLLNVAVLGRFKAGKSSFLNHITGRELLPVGVIPVTSVVTEIEYGPSEKAEVRYLDGRVEAIAPEQVEVYVSESHNPENSKGIERVRVELPSMERFREIRFVDTPGLDSVFEHNTDTSIEWLPNTGLALVAVSVDPPLSRGDIDLIRNLSRHTPHISLLLTKVDTLEERERTQVASFIRAQLARYWRDAVPVFPYSIRPGFEDLRAELDRNLLSQACAGEDHDRRPAILLHKTESLVEECAGYLRVALKAAEAADAERDQLDRRILGQKETLEDSRLTLRLLARHPAGTARAAFEESLRKEERAVRERLLKELGREFPRWTDSLAGAIERFDEWLSASLQVEMAELSRIHAPEFARPAQRAGGQLTQFLQDFRNRLSERTLDALGVPLPAAEIGLRIEEPRCPDTRAGRVFDHNWELVSLLAPMRVFGGLVRRHFEKKVAEAVSTNLSRLASQWDEIVRQSLLALEKDALRRLEALIATMENLTSAAGREAPQIRADLERLAGLRRPPVG